ncbi:MAG: M24 family metallopeptidase [Kordiimonadaceae bacterium]|jgi:Xaa-Pro aminopeptidase|nr:M24 family metallopeptidase [Kordiimonadaceae bacterium]MBT6033742.1 M24 family metallopeptidase [Kordiimonadaceae bacterium]
MRTKTATVIDIEWPEFGVGERPAKVTLHELTQRLKLVRAAMKVRRLTHMLVYGDREHFANLTWMTNIDPRFEEAMLIVDLDHAPLILVGNECEGYLPHSPLFNNGDMRSELFQPFSLLSQPRDKSRLLKDILSAEGIDEGSNVGCVGWKYFDYAEDQDGKNAIDLPSFITDHVRALAGYENVENATDLFMHPGYGFRTVVSVHEIAMFEYSNAKSSEAVKNILTGIQSGMTDYEVAQLCQWDGEPLGCHPTMASGDLPGLCGPQGRTILEGDPFSFNICYWGSNICRAGWVVEDEYGLSEEGRDYIEAFAGPYFEAMNIWFSELKVGTKGAVLHDAIHDRLPFEKFGIFLNAGHLIHLDEWVSSPIYKNSDLEICSGMMMQVDVIPSSPTYGSTRMEDGVVIANAQLRSNLKEKYPDCYARCQARRRFMIEVLGMDVPEDVLPLSNIPAIVPPWFLSPNKVIGLR